MPTELILGECTSYSFPAQTQERITQGCETITYGVRQIFLFSPFQCELDLLRSSPHQLWWTEDNSVLLLSAAVPTLPREGKAFSATALLCLRVNVVLSPLALPLNSSLQNSWQLIHPNKEEFPSNQLLWQWLQSALNRGHCCNSAWDPSQGAWMMNWLGSLRAAALFTPRDCWNIFSSV